MRQLYEIASEIRKEWPNANYAAVPYLNAMRGLSSVTDSYGADNGKTIVLYFLANAGAWRGEAAKRIKAELKEMTK
jgi:hypothetical protein